MNTAVGYSEGFDTIPINQGTYVGTVIERIGPIDAEGLAFEQETFYIVAISAGRLPQTFGPLQPKHRRPVTAPGKIVPAQPNDRCLVCVNGDNVDCIIFEGLAAGVCE